MLKHIRLFSLVFFVCIVTVNAQVPAPDPKNLFVEDSEGYLSKQKKKREAILASDRPVSQELELSAPKLKYISEESKVNLSKGVSITRGDTQLRAHRGTVDVANQVADLNDYVFFSWPRGSLTAQKAKVFLESETGEFRNAKLIADETDFQIKAKKIQKVSEFDYYFKEPSLSSCYCEDGSRPWSVSCSEMKLREEGYARAKDVKLKVNDTSVLYLPYMIFPVKRTRQSGFLAPEFGYGSRDGFRFSIPYFWDVNESTDLIFKPFTQTRTRTGLALDYNQVYSSKSSLKSRFYYSDESARDGNLRGTVIDGLNDPSIDENRLAGFIKQNWKSGPESPIPVSLFSDINYVSDDLILREFDDPELGLYNSRYATSRSVLRTSLGPLLTADLSAEYNQAIISDDDLVFQRAPELSLYSQHTARPFGQNPYGLKLNLSNKVLATNFIRDRGFEGKRYDINPTVKIPYHYKNYFNGELKLSSNHTFYNLSNNQNPDDPTDLITEDRRNVYTLNASVGTAFEKVYDAEPDSTLVWLTSLGRENQKLRLEKIKHVVEPKLSFLYVPKEEQDDLPLFDSLDRLRQRRLISYGVKSSLLGRFSPRSRTADKILELAPEVDELPSVSPTETVPEPAWAGKNEESLAKPLIDRGEVRELATLALFQNFDYLDQEKNTNPDSTPWSDMSIALGLYPADYFGIAFDSNFDVEKQDFSSWGTSTSFRDDRGDLFRLRYSYIEDRLSQIEGNLELVLTDRLKLGYYARFDERDSEFIDNQLAFRFTSACDCWDIDFGFRERLNPDKKDFFTTLTLKGLGQFLQDFSLLDDDEQNN